MAGASRDRDAAGRPRNARPRDALGRPLDRSATGLPAVADQAIAPEQALASAQRLIDDGRPFHAHEVLEAVWKSSAAEDRDLWQGLAQLAVGLTHAMRGNQRGAVALLRRGAARLVGYPPHGPHDIDVVGLTTSANELAVRIERTGLDGVGPEDLRLNLVAGPGHPAWHASVETAE